MYLLQASQEWDTIAKTPLTSDLIRFENGTELQLFPNFKGDVVHKQQQQQQHHHTNNGTRRILGDFRQCSPCTCCDRSRTWCLPTVCCYNIRCGLRGLPFGLCSFTPVSCTCFGCRDWNHSRKEKRKKNPKLYISLRTISLYNNNSSNNNLHRVVVG